MDKFYLDVSYGTVYRLSVDNGNALLFFKDDQDEIGWFAHQYNGIYPSHELITYVRKNVDNELWMEWDPYLPEIVEDKPKPDVEMRGYVFVHRGLDDKYSGIQAAHAMIRLVHANYSNPDVIRWVKDHETLVLLDGGNSEKMEYIASILSGADNVSASFQEPDMGDLTTAIAYVPSEDEMNEICLFKNNKDMGASSNPVVNLLLTTRSHRG